MLKRDPRSYSTAEALAQFALELDGQQQSDEAGNVEPVFTRETRDLLVVEACRALVADGLNIRGE